MRSLVRMCVLVGVLSGSVQLAGAAEPPATGQPGGVEWQASLKSAHLAAKASGKPIMIVFGAEWCTYCHKLERNVINQPETSAYINQNFVPLHLDFDKEPKVAELLGVTSLPCTVVISPNAELLGKYVGYAEAPKFVAQLDEAQATYEQLQTAAGEGTTTTR